MDLDYVQRSSIKAAFSGAEVLRNYFGKLNAITKKGEIDLVTEADVASEKAILSVIQSRFPDHAVLAEESGALVGNDACQWVVDPLDGTTNYANQLGIYAVSIAFLHHGEPIIGTVMNPETREIFTARKGFGATRNGKPIQVSEKDNISDALLVTGFPYNLKTMLQPLIQRFQACLAAARAVRRLGAAALDLCYVACGKFDGFWEQNLQPWDTAAGAVIAEEAGARITDFSGNPFRIYDKEILVSNGNIHNHMISLLELNGLK